MRVIVFFDLPTETGEDRRNYNRFRKHLIRSGYIMVQESVYSKIAVNQTAASGLVDDLKRHKPPKGNLIALTITEKQYGRMEFLLGSRSGDVLASDERLVEL